MRTRLSLAFMLVPCLGLAQSPDRPGWVLVEGALLRQDSSDCVKNAPGLGLAAGSWESPKWGWEATYMHGRLKDKAGLWKSSEDHLDASALFAPWGRTGPWIPFLRGGLGGTRLESPLSLTGNTVLKGNFLAGAGTQILFSPGTLGTLELRSVTVGATSRRQEFELVAGLGFRWGHAVTPATPAPAFVPAAAPAPPPPSQPQVAPDPVGGEPQPAPLPPKPEPPPAPRTAPAPTRIVLDEAMLHFVNGRDDLPAEGVQAVREVAGRLTSFRGDYTLVVTGHTSSVGKPAFNKALSQRRADAVAKVLVDAGIPAAAIQTVGAGPDQPVADNGTKAGQARNRRVEIEVKVKGQDIEIRKQETSLSE